MNSSSRFEANLYQNSRIALNHLVRRGLVIGLTAGGVAPLLKRGSTRVRFPIQRVVLACRGLCLPTTLLAVATTAQVHPATVAASRELQGRPAVTESTQPGAQSSQFVRVVRHARSRRGIFHRGPNCRSVPPPRNADTMSGAARAGLPQDNTSLPQESDHLTVDAKQPVKPAVTHITISQDGQLTFNGRPLQLEELRKIELTAKNIVITVDADAQYARLVEVLDASHEAGAIEFTIQAAKPSTDSGMTDSGTADSRKADSRKADSRKADSRKADSGTADSGTADSAAIDKDATPTTAIIQVREEFHRSYLRFPEAVERAMMGEALRSRLPRRDGDILRSPSIERGNLRPLRVPVTPTPLPKKR